MDSNTPEQLNISSAEQTINRVTGLIQANDLAQAIELLNGLLAEQHGNQMAMHLLGMAQRKAGRLDQAMKLQQAILALEPGFAAAHQEMGLCLRLSGRRREALQAFQRATEADPRLVNSWKFLGDMAAQLGEQETAAEAYSQYPAVSESDPMLERAIELIEGGKLGLADIVIRMYLDRFPQDARAYYHQSRIAVRVAAITEALDLLESTLKYAPGDQVARLDYVNLLSRRQRYEEALAEIEKLLAAEPGIASHRLLKASVLERSGQFKPALSIVEAMLKEGPSKASVWTRQAALQRILGRQDEAIVSLHKAIDRDPDRGEPWYLLADLKVFEFTDGQLQAMRGSVARAPRNSDDEVCFSFALARALESREQYDEAFVFYQRGNAVQKTRSAYDPEAQERFLAAMKSSAASDVFEDLQDAGYPDASPIFVVGLPRSGSTLVEQVLTSHSQVDGMMELPHLSTLIKELNFRQQKKNRSVYPLALAEIDEKECHGIGQEYIERTRILRRSAAFFVDKMPNNFEHIGLIHLALPNARIIDVRRGGMANGFSAYRQLFKAGQEWSYDLQHIGHYYRNYLSLMSHWERVLPGKVFHINYESLVQEPQEEIRKLLNWLDLPFEDTCLEPHRNARAVRTASSEQVRKPIYQDAVAHWKQFETHLQPLKMALGDLDAGG